MTDAEQSELAALRREVKAWRGLIAWEQQSYRRIDWPVDVSSGEETALYSARAHTYGGTHYSGPCWYGRGPTPQSAAIALAEQLGILPKEEA